jgi:hypothetical protein
MYEMRVRGINADNDISLWSDVVKCSTPSVAMPWFEGFESGTMENWLTQSVVGSNKWRVFNGTSTNNSPFAGKYSAFLDYNNNTWMFHSVYLDATKTYEYSMWARQDGTVATNASITVQYGTAATAASMTNTIVAKTGIVNGNYQQLTARFSPSVSGVYHIGIFGNINLTPSFIEVDNISLSTCFQPSTLTSTSVTSKEVSLSWTAGASEIAWDVEYGVKGFALGTGTKINTNTNSSTISGLTSGTTYQFYVRSLCSASETSVWTGPFEATLPYSCPKPTNPLITATSINSAKLAWTAGGTETAW